MLEIGDNFIVLNNMVWKRIGFSYYDRLLKKRDWKIRSDYIYGIRSIIDRLCLVFFMFLEVISLQISYLYCFTNIQKWNKCAFVLCFAYSFVFDTLLKLLQIYPFVYVICSRSFLHPGNNISYAYMCAHVCMCVTVCPNK